MIKYGINVDLMKRLIDKLIMSKTDIFDSYEITMDDNGKRIYIFVTVYFDNRKLASFEKEYYENFYVLKNPRFIMDIENIVNDNSLIIIQIIY